MLMTACDLSDQSKPWSCSKEIARLVYKEFFSQGDLEKAMGHSPSEMMDRERACIPQLQIQVRFKLADIRLRPYIHYI